MNRDMMEDTLKKYGGGKSILNFAYIFITAVIVLYTDYLIFTVYFTNNKVASYVPYLIIGGLIWVLFFCIKVIQYKRAEEKLENKEFAFTTELMRKGEDIVQYAKDDKEAKEIFSNVMDNVSQRIADAVFFTGLPLLVLLIELFVIIIRSR